MNDQNYSDNNMLQEAFTRLNQAKAIRDAYAGGYQIDTNGVSLDTPLSINNAQQAQAIVDTETPVTTDNVIVRLIGTVDETLRNIGQGFFRIGEGIVDYAIGGIGALFGQEEWAEQAISFDITNSVYDWFDNNLSANALYKAQTGNNLYDQSYLYEANDKIQDIVRGVEQGLGSSLAAMGLTAIGTAIGAPQLGLALYSVGAGGSTLQETINSDDYTGNFLGAFGMSTVSGVVEGAVEQLSDLFGIGTFAEKVVGKSFGDTLGNLAKAFVAEGAEEVIGDIAEPFYKGIYNKKSIAENFENDVSAEGLFQSFITGALSGVIMQGASAHVQNVVYSKEGVQIQNEIRDTVEKAKNARVEFETTEQTTLEQQQQAQAKYDSTMAEVHQEMENYANRIKELDLKYQPRLAKAQFYGDVAINDISTGSVENFAKSIVETYNQKSGSQFDVVFDSDINDNGYIDFENNTIHLSQNSTKATRQILSHELTHAIKQANGSEFAKFAQDIQNTLTKEKASQSVKETLKPLFQATAEDGSTYTDYQALNDYVKQNKLGETFDNLYEQKIAYEKAKYGDSLNANQINEEVVSEYVANNLLKSWQDLGSLFQKKSRLQAFKESLSNLISKEKDSKLKKEYQNLFKKLTAKESTLKSQETEMVKASKKDVVKKEETTNVQDEKQMLLDKLNAKFESDSKVANKVEISFSNAIFLNKIENYLAKANISSEEYAKVTSNINNDIINAVRFNSEPISEYLRHNKSNMTLSEVKDLLRPIIDETLQELSSETKIDGKTIKTSAMINSIRNLITALRNDINMLMNVNARSRKATLSLQRNKTAFADMIRQGKQFKNVDSVTKGVIYQLSKIGFTGKSKLNHEARNVLLSTRTSVFENSLYNEALSLDGNAKEYYSQAYKFLEDRINEFTNKNYKKFPGLEANFDISNDYFDKYPALSGKTEAEIAVDIENLVKKGVKGISQYTATLNGEVVNAKQVAQDEMVSQDSKKRRFSFNQSRLGQYFLSLMDMQTYFNIMGAANTNSFFNKMYDELRRGRDKTYEIHQTLAKDLNEYYANNKPLLKELRKSSIKLVGKEIAMGDALSLYLTCETDNAISHLAGDGITINVEKGSPTIISGKEFASLLSKEEFDRFNELTNKKAKTQEENMELSDIKRDVVNNVQDTIKEQIGTKYDELLKLLRAMYKKSGTYYQSASETMNGYSFALKNVFYPTKSNPFAFLREVGNLETAQQFVNTNFNPSFAKGLVEGARNSLQISDVITTANTFMNAISTYAGVTVNIKNVEKFLSAKVTTNKAGRTMSLYEYMNNYVDPRFRANMENLFKAMQGINTQQSTEFNRAYAKVRSAYAKSALGANLKTTLSQFLSFPMAGSYLSTNSLLASFGDKSNLKRIDYLLDNSSYFNNRYYQNNLYNAEAVGALSSVNTFTDWLMKPLQWADKKTIQQIWYACQIETNGDIAKAIELCEKVVQLTQPQYDPLNNGFITRSNSEFVKSTAMFTSVPRKYFSRISESVYNLFMNKNASTQVKSDSLKFFGKTMASFTVGAIGMAALTSLLKALKGDYSDDDKDEIVKDVLLNSFGTNIIGMFPLFKDIYNYFVNDYEVSIAGVSQLNDFLGVIKDDIPNVFDLSSSANSKLASIWQILLKASTFVGIPLRNLYNDFGYLAGTSDLVFKTDLILKMRNLFYDTSNQQLSNLLATYKKQGKESKVSAVIETKVNKYINGGDINEKACDEMARLYMNDSLKALPSGIDDKVTINGSTIELNKAQKSQAQSVYQIANELLLDMINSTYYEALNDEEKARAIQKLYSAYYNLAKYSVDSGFELDKFSYIVDYIDSAKYASVLAKTSLIQADDKESRKTKVSKYINSQRMSASDKYLLYYLSGYNLNESQQKGVETLLKRNGMSSQEISEYFK